jgi:hypothetical protein
MVGDDENSPYQAPYPPRCSTATSPNHPKLPPPARRDSPIQRLRTDRLELVPLFPPRPPTSILQPDPIGDLVLVSRHRPPTRPDVFLGPIVREIVDADGRQTGLDVFHRGRCCRVYRERGEGGDDLSHGDGIEPGSRLSVCGVRCR